jgi:hypothetical protein
MDDGVPALRARQGQGRDHHVELCGEGYLVQGVLYSEVRHHHTCSKGQSHYHRHAGAQHQGRLREPGPEPRPGGLHCQDARQQNGDRQCKQPCREEVRERNRQVEGRQQCGSRREVSQFATRCSPIVRESSRAGTCSPRRRSDAGFL